MIIGPGNRSGEQICAAEMPLAPEGTLRIADDPTV
jgi:hypothetical protein